MSRLTIPAGGVLQPEHTGKHTGANNEEKGKNNIYAGNLNLQQNPVAQKRKEAQEKAWNVVQKAWGSDTSVEDMLETRRQHTAEMERIREDATKKVAELEEDQKVLQQLYGVSDDSEEQQDLEILKKRQDQLSGVSQEQLTEEETKRLQELNEKELTEYQERALELNKRVGTLKKEIQRANYAIMDDTADISRIQIERLKSNPMLEAKKQAEAILDAANEEIKGMVVQAAVDHIDEVMEEAEEKAEENAEEKAEKEEQLEEQRLQRKIQEAMMEQSKEAVEQAKAEQRKNDAPSMNVDEILDITKGNKKVDEVLSSLDDIKSEMKVLEADLKGIKVNEEV